MKTEDRIRELADEFVAQAQARATRLQAELVDAHQRVEKIKAELDAARRAPQRLANFQVKRDADWTRRMAGLSCFGPRRHCAHSLHFAPTEE